MDYTGLKIENKEQFSKVYYLFRSASSMLLEDYIITYGYPNFPIYLEEFCGTYGFKTKPIGTWNNKPFNIINFEYTELKQSLKK